MTLSLKDVKKNTRWDLIGRLSVLLPESFNNAISFLLAPTPRPHYFKEEEKKKSVNANYWIRQKLFYHTIVTISN